MIILYLIKDDLNQTIIWFGSSADLTLYYLYLENIVEFHLKYNELVSSII